MASTFTPLWLITTLGVLAFVALAVRYRKLRGRDHAVERARWAAQAREFLTARALHSANTGLLHPALRAAETCAAAQHDFLSKRIRVFLATYVRADVAMISRTGPFLVEKLRHAARLEEADTIAMLHDELFIARAEDYYSLPAHLQPQALEAGLKVCTSCAEAAERLGDIACVAAYLTRRGNGLCTIGAYEEAAQTFEAARDRWRALAAGQPDRFLPALAETLTHLGNAWDECREWTRAGEALTEAIALLRTLMATQPHYCRELAFALNDLGTLHLARGDTELAQEELQEAMALFRRLPDDEAPPAVLLAWAKTLSNVTFALMDEDDDARPAADAVAAIVRDADAIQERLRPAAATPSLTNVRCRLLLNLGQVLGKLEQTERARTLLAIACEEAEGHGWWDLEASLHQARAAVEQWPTHDPLRGIEHAERAVRTLETGLAALPGFEEVQPNLFRHRDTDRASFKAKLELAYVQCLLHYAERDDHDRVFQFLEAVRDPDRLAGSSLEPPRRDDNGLEAAKAFAAARHVCYLAIQIVPRGALFFAILPSGAVEISRIPIGWRAEFLGLFARIQEITKEIELSPAEGDKETPILDASRGRWQFRLAEIGARLFDLLPEAVQRVFTTDADQIFISAYGDLQHLPLEFLRLPRGQWAGLQHLLPRIGSFSELQAVVSRQPERRIRHALIVADATLGGARATATQIADALTQHAFSSNRLLGSEATSDAFLQRLSAGSALAFYCGHGGYDLDGAFLALANGEKLRATDIARLKLHDHPVLYYDCCQAGITDYRLGGRYVGFGPASINAGASCCLLAARPIVDVVASELTTAFVDALLHGRNAGDALQTARRQIASRYVSPLFWAFPFLSGNPYAQIAESPNSGA